MPIPWALLKALSYPATAIASAGSGALAMYFAKPDVDLEPQNKKWSEEMNKLKGEIEAINEEAKKLEAQGKIKLDSEQKSVNATINSHLGKYSAKVREYAGCLDKLFNNISKYSGWTSSLHYTNDERVKECGQRPVPDKLSK